jgi:serine/threonine protein kinase
LPEYVAVKHVKPSTTIEREIINSFWEKEARNLQDMMKRKEEHILRFLTAFRRGDDVEGGQWDHYLICELADGGSLRDVWAANPKPDLTASLVQEMTIQLLGLAKALVAAHYPSRDSPSQEYSHSYIRHGDLKPENVLCFKGKSILGTLKIGDWGLAKQKNYTTVEQMVKSSRGGGTVRYEPPESWTGIMIHGKMDETKRSRLQDTWAMGCITLEFLIWVIFGVDRIKLFQRDLGSPWHDSAYWEEAASQTLGRKQARIHKEAEKMMDKLLPTQFVSRAVHSGICSSLYE